MVSVQASRFSLLNVDDDSDSADVPDKQNKSKLQQKAAAKKKNKKKKRDLQISAETDELRSLAFGKTKGKAQANGHAKAGKGDATAAQWKEWKKVDDEFAADHFEKDLQDALLMSKIEHEEQAQMRKEFEAAGIVLTDNGKPKKKKTKTKGTMSLDEFQKTEVIKAKRDDDSSEEEIPTSLPPVTHLPQQDPTFFDNVNKDVHKIIQKEKIQEEYQKNFAVDNVRSQHFQDNLAKKDKEIAMLKASHESLQNELKQVKKRNQQLCHILAQGEMKDKTKILLEVDDLREVRDELTQEVTNLTSELEKERSKVHQLQGEAIKHKGGKHKQ